MDKKILNSKSGIIVKCPPVSTGIVKIYLKSTVDLDIYYTNEENINTLKSTGSFKDQSGVSYTKKGNDISDLIHTILGESYFLIVNDTTDDAEFSFEIKVVNINPVLNTSSTFATASSTAGFGTSGYGSYGFGMHGSKKPK